MYKVNPEEREYAFLRASEVLPEKSLHGSEIDLDRSHKDLVNESLNINGDSSVGDNPNRYKQHGFHFTADNCIACHACEAACSQKNELPPHLAFRKVGYIESGLYPSFMRMNISMACNHCENPVCLKGCPTRAYTKFVEYGAVLQDPEICFGCGYCTWVCPYNAPYLDPLKGTVSKCNMCVDRLEAGLKPACAAACLGNALNFGVIEDIPENREQAELKIPAFSDESISRPNIRFQQIKSLGRDFTRVDNVPIHYHRDDNSGEYRTKVTPGGADKGWGLKRLNSRENPLVIFTILSQTAMGGYITNLLLNLIGGGGIILPKAEPALEFTLLLVLLGMQAFGLLLSTMHLGRPMRFYRGFNNLRYSWLSREALCVSIFFGPLSAALLFAGIRIMAPGLITPAVESLGTALHLGGALIAALSLFAMNMAYRIKARPFWNHWHTLGAFTATALILGPLTAGLVYATGAFYMGVGPGRLLELLSLLVFTGVVIQCASLLGHYTYLRSEGAEGGAALQVMVTDFGKTYGGRIVMALFIMCSSAFMAFQMPDGSFGYILFLAVFILATIHELLGRAIFYVLVIPTTMPGAFFWRNKAFEEHARETGLSEMPQVGVLPETH